MIAAVIAGTGVLLALLALTTYVVTIVRTTERERAAALQLAERLQGETNLGNEKARRDVAALAQDLQRMTRRADALEDYIRGDLIRRFGIVDDGVDLLLAELGVVAAGPLDDAGTVAAPSGGGSSGTVALPRDGAEPAPTAGGAGGAGGNGDVSKGKAS